jgi:diacylglycerol kinase family enzyme
MTRELKQEVNTSVRGSMLASSANPQYVLKDIEMNRSALNANIKSVLIIYNPISGSGQALRIANLLNDKLIEQGLKTDLIVSQTNYEPSFVERLNNFNLVLVVGGDGTLSKLVNHLASSALPVYMLPAGNESLFSKTFEMTANLEKIIQLIKSGNVTEHYYGLVNNNPFFTMLSVGFDSLVISKIGERKTTSSDFMYIKAGLLSLFSYRTPQISLVVDGVNAIHNEKGYLIIAHNPGYARNLNLVPEAKNSEPRLWARFFPQATLIPELVKFLKMAFKLPANLKGSRLYSGNRFELSISNGAYPYQYDGEYGGMVGECPLVIENSKSTLKVLS